MKALCYYSAIYMTMILWHRYWLKWRNNVVVFAIFSRPSDFLTNIGIFEFICLKISKFSIRGIPPDPLVKRDECCGQFKCPQEKIFQILRPKISLTVRLCIFFVYFYIFSTKIKLKYTHIYFQFETAYRHLGFKLIQIQPWHMEILRKITVNIIN